MCLPPRTLDVIVPLEDAELKRLILRPGAISDCIVSLPAMEWLKADYTPRCGRRQRTCR